MNLQDQSLQLAPPACPRGGPRKRWRDVIRNNLREVGVREDEWYMEATSSRGGWRTVCQERTTRDDQGGAGVEQPTCQVQCKQCKRCFRREGDKKRHKCVVESCTVWNSSVCNLQEMVSQPGRSRSTPLQTTSS